MASNLNREKRETQFPEKLWPDNGSIVKESTEIEKPNEKLVQNNYAYRLGVPIIPTENINSSSTVKVESPAQYHLSYNIDQAGPGVIGLKDTENLPTCFLKQSNIGECLMKRRSRDGIKEDIEAIGSIVTSLSDRPTHVGDPKQGLGMPSLSKLAQSFVEKANTSSSAEDLLKVSII
ncbi:hypothetical protein PENFLA_c094G10071 [Penicillium flavigenum]|uniref:Uncharacterized protein n=1 Tax=Penicillium flavigenum TaxID=254877 RepID=A0A1V6S8K4_9EURO|nr:hypothetical protein PENFLA_c094G10071 [Penicillium flavigenum]